MVVTVPERVAFSDLLQHTRDTVARLERSRSRRLRLVRRAGEDLILESAGRAEAAEEALNFTTRLVAEVLRTDQAVLTGAFGEVFPWLRFLTPDQAATFTAEFVRTARACAELGTVTPMSEVVAGWRATAKSRAEKEPPAREHDSAAGD